MSLPDRDELVSLCAEAAQLGKVMSYADFRRWVESTGRDAPAFNDFAAHGGYRDVADAPGLATTEGVGRRALIARLRDAHRDLGVPLDEDALADWEAERGFADSTADIRRTLGSLRGACDVAGVPYAKRPLRYTQADLIDLLRRTYEATGKAVTYSTMLAWAEQAGVEPVPSRMIFIFRFGSFTSACQAAGVPNIPKGGGWNAGEHIADPDTVIALLQRAYADLGEPLTYVDVRAWVEATGAGRWPSRTRLNASLGSFADACAAAGVPSRSHRRLTYTDDQIFDVLRRAYDALGGTPSYDEVRQWADDAGIGFPASSVLEPGSSRSAGCVRLPGSLRARVSHGPPRGSSSCCGGPTPTSGIPSRTRRSPSGQVGTRRSRLERRSAPSSVRSPRRAWRPRFRIGRPPRSMLSPDGATPLRVTQPSTLCWARSAPYP